MNPVDPAAALQSQTQALLDLVEQDHSRQAAALAEQTRAAIDAVRRQAFSQARTEMRQAFAEQRRLQQQRVAAALAQLATQRRLHEQQHTARLLQRAGQRLPAELLALWCSPDARGAWVALVVAAARLRLPPPGPWQVRHAPGWPDEETAALAARLQQDGLAAPVFACDAGLQAGLKLAWRGNVVDGTLQGLLGEPAELQARLLHELRERTS